MNDVLLANEICPRVGIQLFFPDVSSVPVLVALYGCVSVCFFHPVPMLLVFFLRALLGLLTSRGPVFAWGKHVLIRQPILYLCASS